MPSSQGPSPFDELPSNNIFKTSPVVRAQWKSDRRRRILYQTVTRQCGHESVIELKWDDLSAISEADLVSKLTRLRSTICGVCTANKRAKGVRRAINAAR